MLRLMVDAARDGSHWRCDSCGCCSNREVIGLIVLQEALEIFFPVLLECSVDILKVGVHYLAGEAAALKVGDYL